MEYFLVYSFVSICSGILITKIFSISVPIAISLILIGISLILKGKYSPIFFFFSLIIFGTSIYKPVPEGAYKDVFIQCKVLSVPQFYYGKYKYDCIVSNSENKEFIGKTITIISEERPYIFSDVKAIGKYRNGRFFPFLFKNEVNSFSSIDKIREFLQSRYFEKSLNFDSFSIGNALIFGDRGYLSSDTKEAFNNTGLAHLLSISGLHVAIVFTIVLGIFWIFGKKVAYTSAILSMILFPFISGLHIPVIRSSAMAILYTYGKISGFKINPFNILLFVAVLSVLFNPNVLFSISFQLSFIAVLGLILCSKYLKFKMDNKLLEFLLKSVLVSFFASLFTMPLIVYYFERFSPVSILATTAEIGILYAFIFLEIINLITGFSLDFTVKLMDYLGLFLINLTKFFSGFNMILENLNPSVFIIILFYISIFIAIALTSNVFVFLAFSMVLVNIFLVISG